MKENNPWLNIPYTDYERHMTHSDVGQLQQLNAIIADKIEQYAPKTVAVFGACTGNGLEHFNDAEMIYTIDINPGYLEICKQRFGQYVNSLKCIVADIDRDELEIPRESIDLVICHLFLEYVDAQAALNKMQQIMSADGILNVVIQENRSNSFVSNTGVSSLAPLSAFGKPVKERSLFEYRGLEVVGLAEYELPNGKVFKSIDLKKRNIANLGVDA